MELNIDRKAIKNGIKKGFGFNEFGQKYGMDRESLEEALYILYKHNPSDARRIIQDISSNEKKRARNRKQTTREPSTKVATEAITEVVEEVAAEVTVAEPDVLASMIAALEAEIEALSAELAKAEAIHASYLSEFHAHKKKLSLLDELLAQLEAKILAIQTEYNAEIENGSLVVQKANEALAERRELEAKLEEKRRKLETLKVITLCVCADGSVVLMDDTLDIQLDTTGYHELYMQLVDSDICQDLRAREIKAIAKAMKVIENISHTFEVVCDNSEMEEAYKALTGGSKTDASTENCTL